MFLLRFAVYTISLATIAVSIQPYLSPAQNVLVSLLFIGIIFELLQLYGGG